MEEWRALAYRVQSTLVSFVCGEKAADFLWLVNAAHTKLATRDYYMGSVLMGATDLELDAVPNPPPEGCTPKDLIERACLEFEALKWEHAMAGHIVTLYGASHGLLHGHPLWQAWEGHHATAIQNGEGVLRGLHDAAASNQAAADALGMTESLPCWSPAWVAWSSAAQSLTRRAVSEVATARSMVLLMRDAVILEYTAAGNVLNG